MNELALPPAGGIHAWILDMRRLAPTRGRLTRVLCEEELQRADRFRLERDRVRFVTCRGALRHLLAAYMGFEASALAFGSGSHGKPRVEAPAGCPAPSFNISHSGDLGLIAVTSEGEIGCDVEFLRRDLDLAQMMRIVFTDEEAVRVQSLPQEHRHEAFFRGWTRKEALVKAVGDGLYFPLKSVNVFPADQRSPLSIALADTPSSEWRIHDMQPAPDYFAAVAGHGPSVVDWRVWTP